MLPSRPVHSHTATQPPAGTAPCTRRSQAGCTHLEDVGEVQVVPGLREGGEAQRAGRAARCCRGAGSWLAAAGAQRAQQEADQQVVHVQLHRPRVGGPPTRRQDQPAAGLLCHGRTLRGGRRSCSLGRRRGHCCRGSIRHHCSCASRHRSCRARLSRLGSGACPCCRRRRCTRCRTRRRGGRIGRLRRLRHSAAPPLGAAECRPYSQVLGAPLVPIGPKERT